MMESQLVLVWIDKTVVRGLRSPLSKFALLAYVPGTLHAAKGIVALREFYK